MDKKPKNLWITTNSKYQSHVTISTIDSTIKSENVDERVVYIEDLEKRKQDINGVNLVMLKDLRITLKIGL
ncbi:hypothetical protein RhiirA4_412515, partial [Rhizophagus irregularis]